MNQNIHLHFDVKKYPHNSLALQILNAFYSSLILKKMEGVEITAEVENQVLEDVVRRMAAIEKMIAIAETESQPKGDH